MATNRETGLENRIALNGFLSSVFLTLPDEEFLKSLLTLQWEDSDSVGCNAIAEYAAEQAGRDHEEVLLELGRDRARLIRGANNEGMQPPYESLYAGQAANESMGSLNRFYADAGFLLADNVKDTVDQLGVELAFYELLMTRELEALREGKDDIAEQWLEVRRHFYSQHLGRWAHAYAAEMLKHAKTGFYRGIALLIEETV